MITTRKTNIKRREPRTISDGLTVAQEASIFIDYEKISISDLYMIRRYINDGLIKVCINEVVEE